MGEVGTAHYNLLSKTDNLILRRDIAEIDDIHGEIDGMIIAIRYSDKFIEECKDYELEYAPDYINILSTVPPGTCEKLGEIYTHSTTRGIHPNLEQGLLNIQKHIGGKHSSFWAILYQEAGIKCCTHKKAITTELAHILNNTAYGVNLMLADEMQKVCRQYGVDYFEAVMLYTLSNNIGFTELDNPTKTRMILTPPNGKIGGHCVTMSANLLEDRPPIIDMLSKYNKGE